MEQENLRITQKLEEKIKAKSEELSESLKAQYQIDFLYKLLESIKRESKDPVALQENCRELETIVYLIKTEKPIKNKTVRTYRRALKSFVKTYAKRHNLKTKWQYSRFWQFWGWGIIILSVSIILTGLETHVDHMFIMIFSAVLSIIIGFSIDKYFEKKGKVI